jgi:hypothetical protein
MGRQMSGRLARARIRTLLAMEARVEPDAQVSVEDVTRVDKALRAGEDRHNVFPRVDELTTRIEGSGVTITVHFTKKQGAPVRFPSDAATPVAAVREVDLRRTYHRSATDLAKVVGLTNVKSTALRRHLGIDEGPGLLPRVRVRLAAHPALLRQRVHADTRRGQCGRHGRGAQRSLPASSPSWAALSRPEMMSAARASTTRSEA